MKPADDRAEALLREALQRTKGPEREAYLDQACAGNQALRARLEALLQARESSDPFLEPQEAPPTSATVPISPEESPGTLVGRYKILEKIGEGGYGLLYVAEQREPVKRQVALKIIKLGMDTTFKGHMLGAHGVAFSPDSRRLATGGGSGREAVKLWDLSTQRELVTLVGQGLLFQSVSFSLDGNWLSASSAEGRLHLWRAPSWAEIETTEKANRNAP